MKFKEKIKDCHLIIKAKASFGEKIDEKELDRFARVYLRGFLKPKLIKKNNIEYAGPVGISLQKRLEKSVSKRDFLFIVEHIVVALQKLEANKLPISNLVMDIRNVYINEVTKEIQFLYVPVVQEKNNTDIYKFMESIIYSAKPETEGDTEYISRFVYFFKSLQSFDTNKIEQFIAKEDKSVVQTIKKHNLGQSGFMTDKQQHYYEHYEEKNSDVADEATGFLYEEENTGLLEDEATGFLYEEENTGLLEDEEATGFLIEDDGPSILLPDDDEGMEKAIHYASLERLSTNETISLNKPVFRIGKERSYVDYFVTDNNTVSRSHADIITRGNRHFVIDLNSKNHTYLNGQMLESQCEVELHEGDTLKLAREEFIFHK